MAAINPDQFESFESPIHPLISGQPSVSFQPEARATLPWPSYASETKTTSLDPNLNNINSLGLSDYPTPSTQISAFSTSTTTAVMNNFHTNALTSEVAPTADLEGWASAQDWVKHRALITELYPRLMLKEIMHFMETEHNFRATEKMYKSRFSQWGLRKNAKRKHEIADRSGPKKRTIFGAGCQSADNAEDSALVVSSTALQAERSFTSLSHQIMTPEVLAIPERILASIRNYLRGSFEAGTWKCDGEFEIYYSTKLADGGFSALDRLYSQCILACNLFARNSFQEAGKMLISATAHIKRILLAELPRTLDKLFDLIENLCRSGRDEIALAILRQFSAMGSITLGYNHPLCRIAGLLTSIDPSLFNDIIGRCVRSVADHFESLIGPMHHTTLAVRVRHIFYHGRCEEELRGLLNKYENDLASHDIRTLFVRHVLAICIYGKRKYAEAEQLGQEILAHSQHLHSPWQRDYYWSQSLYIIAISQHALGKRHSAESHLLEAIELIRPTDLIRAMYLLSKLEEWLLEQGRDDSAAELRERRWRMLLKSMENE